MKRFIALVLSICCLQTLALAQDPATSLSDTLPSATQAEAGAAPAKKNVNLSQLELANRSKDHFLLQVGIDSWMNKPDSIQTRGLSRSFNLYFMFDFPFKTNPKLSVALGAGVSSNNMYFRDTYIDITGREHNELRFTDVSDTTHFKKYKLVTTYLEAPVELRYTRDPSRPKKSLKGAIGLKVGTMVGASTKGKTLQNGSGQTLRVFTQKEKSRQFFNPTRISLTARVGIGSFSLFGSYQVSPFVREGMGPDVRPLSVGLTLSGL